jgi:hypothetical protein
LASDTRWARPGFSADRAVLGGRSEDLTRRGFSGLWSQTGDPLRTPIAFSEELVGPVHPISQNCSSWSASSASCAEKDAGDSSRARNRTSLCSGQSLASSTRTVVSPRSMVSLAEIATALPRQAHAHRRDGQCQRPQHRGRGRSCDRVLLRPVGLSSGNAPSSQLSLCWIAAGACGPRHPANAVGRLCSCRQRQGHRSGRSPPVPGAFRPLRRVNEPQRLTL